MAMLNDEGVGKRHAAVRTSRTFKNLRVALGLGQKKVLDAGCGYGEYLAHFGEGSIGVTTTPHEVAYGQRHGLDIRPGNVEDIVALGLPGEFDAVWANNIFEHLLSPHAFLISLKTVITNDGHIILGVPVVPVLPSLLFRFRKFRGALASNHIGFYTRHTLSLTAKYAGWRTLELRPFIFKNHFLDRLLSPLAPHLYLVARNDTDFSYAPKKLKEWEDDSRYQELIAIAGPKR